MQLMKSPNTPAEPLFDAIVVGGSFSGLSAALQLARARRRLLVVDAGLPRNRFAAHSHGFLGQDGRPPAEILAQAREQLARYPTVQWLQATATQARVAPEGGFLLHTDAGSPLAARRLLLATGVLDKLPPVPGLAERWGRSVFHCPYCHGYELNQGRIGVVAASPLAQHHALLLPDWGTVTLFLNGAHQPDDEQAAALQARGVAVVGGAVREVTGSATVVMEDGRRHEMDGLFTQPVTEPAGPLARQLGCELEDSPMGRFVRTGPTKETTVPGVFACGDAARAAGNVALSVGDGALAGAGVHQSLVFRG